MNFKRMIELNNEISKIGGSVYRSKSSFLVYSCILTMSYESMSYIAKDSNGIYRRTVINNDGLVESHVIEKYQADHMKELAKFKAENG